MKKKIKLNGDLKNILLKGGVIIDINQGKYYVIILVKNPEGSEFKYSQYQNFLDINSEKMILASSSNRNKISAINDCSDDFNKQEADKKWAIGLKNQE